MSIRLLGTVVILAGIVPCGRCEDPGAPAARTDRHGDPLPPGAVARLGTLRWRHPGASWMGYAQDGKSLYSVGEDLRQWDVKSGRELRRWKLPTVPASVKAVCPDRRTVLLTSRDTIWLVDAAAGAVRWKAEGGRRDVESAAFSPDGKRVAVRDYCDSSARLLDAATGRQVRRLGTADKEPERDFPTRAPLNLAFSPDGQTLAVGSELGELRLWDVATGKVLLHRREKSGRVSAVAFAPDGKRLAWGDGANVVVWDVTRGREVRRLACGDNPPRGLTFSPDGKRLAVSAGLRRIGIWDVEDGKKLLPLTPLPALHSTYLYDKPMGRWLAPPVAFAPDGKELAVVVGLTLHRWDAVTGRERQPFVGHAAACGNLTFSPDGRIVVSVALEEEVVVWESATGRQLWRTRADEVPGLAFSPDGASLAVVADDFSLARRIEKARPGGKPTAVEIRPVVHLYDATTGKERRRFPVVVEFLIHAIRFTPDGKTLIVHEAETVSWWDAATGKERRRHKRAEWESPFLIHGAVTDDYRFEARAPAVPIPGEPTLVRLRDWDTEKDLPSVERPTNADLHVAFSPDGRTLVLAVEHSKEKKKAVIPGWTFSLWETATGKPRGHFTAPGGRITRMTVAPGNRILAAVFAEPPDDYPIRLWDLSTGKSLGSLSGHRREVSALAFFPDGRRLASASEDTAILVWDVASRIAPPGKPPALSGRELKALWDDLAGRDAARAFRAVERLAAAPRDSVPFLRARLRPAAVDLRHVGRLIRDLDSGTFAVRERAMRELGTIGEPAAPLLRKTLGNKPSLEMRRRVEDLLAKHKRWALSGDDLRTWRALEVLEQAGTQEARDVLAALGRGDPNAWQTREARGALRRVDRRTGPRERKR